MSLSLLFAPNGLLQPEIWLRTQLISAYPGDNFSQSHALGIFLAERERYNNAALDFLKLKHRLINPNIDHIDQLVFKYEPSAITTSLLTSIRNKLGSNLSCGLTALMMCIPTANGKERSLHNASKLTGMILRSQTPSTQRFRWYDPVTLELKFGKGLADIKEIKEQMDGERQPYLHLYAALALTSFWETGPRWIFNTNATNLDFFVLRVAGFIEGRLAARNKHAYKLDALSDRLPTAIHELPKPYIPQGLVEVALPFTRKVGGFDFRQFPRENSDD